MEEKNKKISISTILLIISIIALIVMGVFIYKLNNDKNAEIQKSIELQAKVADLNTVEKIVNKIDIIQYGYDMLIGNLNVNLLFDDIVIRLGEV